MNVNKILFYFKKNIYVKVLRHILKVKIVDHI